MIKQILISFLFLFVVVNTYSMGNPDSQYSDRVTSRELGGDDRYQIFVFTDKPVYKPADPVYFRALVLNAKNHTPFLGGGEINLQILGPQDNIIEEITLPIQNAISSVRWGIPNGLAGGIYRVVASGNNYAFGFSSCEGSFEIRSYRASRLKTSITFLKDGYTPGEKVNAICEVQRIEGGIPVGALVSMKAVIDGNEVYSQEAILSNDGVCYAEFDLPKNIISDQSTLAFIIQDGGVVESAAKSIPLLLDNFTIDIYPEGGKLIAGLKNKVYIECRLANGKPADMDIDILNSSGNLEASFKTIHEGRASFNIVPRIGEVYTLVSPALISSSRNFILPRVSSSGVVLRALEPVSASGENIKLEIASSHDRNLQVVISQKEVQVAEGFLDIAGGQRLPLSIKLPENIQGVLIVTVLEGHLPLAERLIYREPQDKINISLKLDKSNPVPGDMVTLTVTTKNDSGKAVPATVGLVVSDETSINMIEKRELPALLPTMVFLENEVNHLEDARVYFDPANKEAANQLDLLLGTQGWRRFAFYKWSDFYSEYGEKAQRLAAENKVIVMDKLVENEDIFLFPMAVEEKGARAMEGMVFKEEAPMNVMPKDNHELFDEEQNLIGNDFPDELLMEDQFNQKIDSSIVNPGFIVIREYAHKRRENWSPANRNDFTETLYWNTALRTNEKTGEAQVRFHLSDSITSFAVTADAFTEKGVLGAGTSRFTSVKPVYVEPKMPLEVRTGDHVIMPVVIVNNLEKSLTGTFKAYLNNQIIKTVNINVNQNSRIRHLVGFDVSGATGEQEIKITMDFDQYSDNVTRKFQVKAPGFPISLDSGGMIGPDLDVIKNISIPQNLMPGSLTSNITVYPSPVANLTKALEALIRQPYGCFEQTSSTSYPLVMAQQYFLTHQGVDPSLIRSAQENLDQAYQRLISFESPKEGYEWFGSDPGHEALTAYGLMQFMEMSEVMDVDQSMIQRTRAWLLSRRDNNGGFRRNQLALDSFGGAPANTTNAYITWALLEAGESDLSKEIELIRDIAFSSTDSYILALGANILFKAGDEKGAQKLMEFLVAAQADEGSVEGAVTSITRSRGVSLVVETTSLAILAWLKDEKYSGNVEKAMKYLVAQCQDGMFYSTQATILALKAIILYDQSRASVKAAGSLQLLIDGKAAGSAITFSKDHKEAILLPNIIEFLIPGNHKLSLIMEGGSKMPYSINIDYTSPVPVSSKESRLLLETKMNGVVPEGSSSELVVKITNTSDEDVPTPIAIIGVPGGMEPRYDQLKELAASDKIDAYEVLGQEIVLYWRQFKAGEVKDLSLTLMAALPGYYQAPASRVYEYYSSEYKYWVAGESANIKAK